MSKDAELTYDMSINKTSTQDDSAVHLKQQPKARVKFPIGAKLISVMAVLLFSATFVLIYVATDLFSRDKKSFIDLGNLDSASQLASQTNDYVSHLVSTVTSISEIQGAKSLSRDEKNKNIFRQFERYDEIQSVGVWVKNSNSITNFGLSSKADPKLIDVFRSVKPGAKTWQGEIDIQRVTSNGKSFLAVSFPLSIAPDKTVYSVCVSVFTPIKLVTFYSKSKVFTSYLVDREGNLLAHPKESLVSSGANFREVPIVKDMLESPNDSAQKPFTDKDGQNYFGAYKKAGVAGIGVVTQVLEATAMEAIKRVKYRSILVAGIVLFLAFSIIYFFSKTITRPIRYLVDLTAQIAHGDFTVHVHPKGNDEVTLLTKSFGEMATGLAERDKIKDAFNRFQSKEIAEAILKGEIKLGGSRQKATVFFSDIRGFTAMSETMPPEDVVEMLNDYMTVMVNEVTVHKGVVDKYVGDAIMAVWGVPLAKGEEEWNAVKCCIAMRKRLEEFNKKRESQGKNTIHIGMGLHSGELIAGNIGSMEKLSYTVIGDTVNIASRVESLTKEFGTDLLISDTVYEQIKTRVIVEPLQANVKGKSQSLKVYKVTGYFDEAGQPIMCETSYSNYSPTQSDKVIRTDSKKSA